MNIDNEKSYELYKAIDKVYCHYRAFLKTIDLNKNNQNNQDLITKFSNDFINGTYDKNHYQGIHQVVLLAINKIDTPLDFIAKRNISKHVSCVAFYLDTMNVKNKEFELAIQPFKLLWKYCKQKGLKTNEIDYLLKSEWNNDNH